MTQFYCTRHIGKKNSLLFYNIIFNISLKSFVFIWMKTIHGHECHFHHDETLHCLMWLASFHFMVGQLTGAFHFSDVVGKLWMAGKMARLADIYLTKHVKNNQWKEGKLGSLGYFPIWCIGGILEEYRFFIEHVMMRLFNWKCTLWSMMANDMVFSFSFNSCFCACKYALNQLILYSVQEASGAISIN